jgi:hypothetical protein
MAREAGFNAHIGKPMSIDRLTSIILELLPQRSGTVTAGQGM